MRALLHDKLVQTHLVQYNRHCTDTKHNFLLLWTSTGWDTNRTRQHLWQYHTCPQHMWCTMSHQHQPKTCQWDNRCNPTQHRFLLWPDIFRPGNLYESAAKLVNMGMHRHRHNCGIMQSQDSLRSMISFYPYHQNMSFTVAEI
jgi:hypothetical protein